MLWRDQLVAELPVGVYELSDNPAQPPRFVFVSARAAQLFGVSRDALMADFSAAFANIHPDELERALALNDQARQTGSVFEITARFVLNGQTRWLNIRSRPRDAGAHRRWAGIITDVTEQTTAEHDLAERERLLANMSRLSGTGGWQLEVADGTVRWTRQTYVIHDLPGDQSLDLEQALSYYHPDDRLRLEQAIARAIEHGEPYDLVLRMTTARQRSLIVRSFGEPVYQDGRVIRLVGAFEDITEQTASQRRLAEAEARFRLLFEHSPLAIMVHDVDTGEIVDANPAAWQSYGLESLEALQRRDLWAEPPYSRTEALALIRAAAEGQPQSFEWVSIDAQGRRFREVVKLNSVMIDGQLRVFSSSIDISELHAARQRFRTMFDASPVAITVQDVATGELLEANAQAWRAWGFESLAQMLSDPDRIWLDAPYDRDAAVARMQQAVACGGEQFEWPTRHASGRVIWHEVSISPLEVDGCPCALSVSVDITIRRKGEALLRESEERFRRLLEDLEGVAVQGYSLDGTVNYWNRASEALYGYSEQEVLGANLLELIIPPNLREQLRDGLASVAAGGSIPSGELELIHKDGHRVTVQSSHTVLRRPGHPPELFCVDIDISERKHYEDALRRIANYDSLTGLPNRNLLSELMREQTARAERSGHSYALCYLDLDEFKPINDQHGHEIGGRVLVAVAERLRRLVRGSDVVARLGGDEFVLIFEGLDETGALDNRLQRVLDRIGEPVQVGELSLQVQASIGVTLYPQDQADPDTLLRHADQAMYQAKTEGRNRYSLFDAKLEEGVQRRRQRLLEIEQGLKEGQFCLYYHPKVDLRDGRVVGLEALVRWQHPVEGLLGPGAFLGDLIHSELERQFGACVIDQALAQMDAWADESLSMGVSINVSGHHLLHPDFVEELEGALRRYPRVRPASLVIEIVESAAVADLEQAVRVLQRVKQLGVQTALDDFGTGYSSLSHLRSLPVDEVKVDQGFVRDMLSDLSDYNIVRSVLGLAEAFSLRSVAEGVESPEHIATLQSLDCQLGQGYVFSRPLPASEVAGFLAEWPARADQLIRRSEPQPLEE